MVKRWHYLVIVMIIILVGLLSRQLSFVPLYIGDVLWAMMIYYGMKMLFVYNDYKVIGLYSILICYLVEFGQLINTPALKYVRATLLGRLVLGQGFLWSDLLAYSIGIGLCVLLEKLLAHDHGFDRGIDKIR